MPRFSVPIDACPCRLKLDQWTLVFWPGSSAHRVSSPEPSESQPTPEPPLWLPGAWRLVAGTNCGQHHPHEAVYVERPVQQHEIQQFTRDTRQNTANTARTSTISNGTVLLLTVPAIVVRLAARAWQDRSTAIQGGAKPVASSTHLEQQNKTCLYFYVISSICITTISFSTDLCRAWISTLKYNINYFTSALLPFSTCQPFFALPHI